MTEPTDADREKATEIRQHFLMLAETPPGLEDAIAAALAAERAAAVADLRARVLELAEDVSGLACDYEGTALTGSNAYRQTAARLRAAVTDTTGDPA